HHRRTRVRHQHGLARSRLHDELPGQPEPAADPGQPGRSEVGIPAPGAALRRAQGRLIFHTTPGRVRSEFARGRTWRMPMDYAVNLTMNAKTVQTLLGQGN